MGKSNSKSGCNVNFTFIIIAFFLFTLGDLGKLFGGILVFLLISIAISEYFSRCPKCKKNNWATDTREISRSATYYKHEEGESRPYQNVTYDELSECQHCGHIKITRKTKSERI